MPVTWRVPHELRDDERAGAFVAPEQALCPALPYRADATAQDLVPLEWLYRFPPFLAIRGHAALDEHLGHPIVNAQDLSLYKVLADFNDLARLPGLRLPRRQVTADDVAGYEMFPAG